jgi:hypothetical protein
MPEGTISGPQLLGTLLALTGSDVAIVARVAPSAGRPVGLAIAAATDRRDVRQHVAVARIDPALAAARFNLMGR